jgi:hypothetical protein
MNVCVRYMTSRRVISFESYPLSLHYNYYGTTLAWSPIWNVRHPQGCTQGVFETIVRHR